MKKSNILMLSYMIFLAITLLANIFFNWNGLDRIAMAVTIAGCFFAFADLFNWKASFNKYSCDRMKIVHKHIVDTNNAQTELIEEREKELKYILNKATPYRDKNSKIAGIIDCATEILQQNKSKKEELLQSKLEIVDIYKDIEKEEKKIRIFEVVESVFMIFGFVLFFSIIAFDWLFFSLTNYQTLATIIAFIAIMFNYYAKDVIEEKPKAVFDTLIKKAEANKLEIEKISQGFKEINLSETVDAFIKTIEKTDKLSQHTKQRD